MSKDYLWLHLRDLPYFRAMLRAVEASFYEHASFSSPLLDIGCGDGHFTEIAFDGLIDIGVDPDLQIMREAQSRQVYRMLLQSDGGKLPLPDASIGSAFSNSVLEHIPHLDQVLLEVGRVLKVGAPFLFTVPNPGYRSELSIPAFLNNLGLTRVARAYENWFMRMSRTIHLDDLQGWRKRLEPAGLVIKEHFDYFSPQALHMLEWGHYFGAPCLIPRWVLGRWILTPTRWNLALTERWVKRVYDTSPVPNGTYSYYLAHKR
jgi:SAM-dependent methyltransferase